MAHMLPSTLAIWRAIRDAGEAGIRAASVYRLDVGDGAVAGYDNRQRSRVLEYLRFKGYVRIEGVCRGTRYFIGRNTPKGESREIDAGPQDAAAKQPQAAQEQACA